MAQPEIVVVGSTNLDFTVTSDRIPQAGETVAGTSFSENFGGKGANQAVAAARTGVPVHMISAVGHDAYAERAIDNFRSHNISTEGLFSFDTSTGMAHIWVDRNGENRIILIPGANHRLTEDGAIEKFQQIINQSPNIGYVIGQCEIPISVTTKVFVEARKKNVVTILNPAPFQPLSEELLANTTWLIINETEFQALHPDNSMPTSDEVIRTLPRRTHVIVTLGSAGALLIDEHGELSRLSAPEKKVVDTTGAGDCLIGAFVSGLALNLSPLHALKFGIACASESVTRIGAQTAYPSQDWCLGQIKTLVKNQ